MFSYFTVRKIIILQKVAQNNEIKICISSVWKRTKNVVSITIHYSTIIALWIFEKSMFWNVYYSVAKQTNKTISLLIMRTDKYRLLLKVSGKIKDPPSVLCHLALYFCEKWYNCYN